MQVQVNFANFDATEAIDTHAREQVERSLKRWTDRLTRVEIHLMDVNGPKAGVDMRCRIEARPAGMDPLHVEATREDLYPAIDEAASKLDRALTRRFEKHDERVGR